MLLLPQGLWITLEMPPRRGGGNRPPAGMVTERSFGMKIVYRKPQDATGGGAGAPYPYLRVGTGTTVEVVHVRGIEPTSPPTAHALPEGSQLLPPLKRELLAAIA